MSDEAMTSFREPSCSGLVRMGTPDDYADRFLPEILARFSRTHPLVQVEVACQGSDVLVERTRRGELDLAIVTCTPNEIQGEVVRREPLIWVTSARHHTHEQEVVPLALSNIGCAWRQVALDALDKTGRAYRMAYTSQNSAAISAAVLAGLAVAAVPKMVLKPGMRVLRQADGFPDIGSFDIGMVRKGEAANAAAHALADHIAGSLADYAHPPMAAE